MQAAGGTDIDGTGSQMQWTINALQKNAPKSKIGDDSISQVGSQNLQQTRSAHGSVQSGTDFLSKQKLQSMEKKYQESRGPPSVFTASKVGS